MSLLTELTHGFLVSEETVKDSEEKRKDGEETQQSQGRVSCILFSIVQLKQYAFCYDIRSLHEYNKRSVHFCC